MPLNEKNITHQDFGPINHFSDITPVDEDSEKAFKNQFKRIPVKNIQ